MRKERNVYGGKRQQKGSKLPLLLGVLAAVIVIVLCVILFGGAGDTKDPVDDDGDQQTDIDTNTGDLDGTDEGNTDDDTGAGTTDGNKDDGVTDGNAAGGTDDGTTSDTTDAGGGNDSGMPDRGPEPIADPQKGSRPWNLVLVNPWNFLPETAEIPLAWSDYGGQVDARCVDALDRMLDDCSAAGLVPIICSAYRTWDTQTSLFNGTVDYYQYTIGMPYEEAKAAAATETAWPGTSEHQLGLAVDIVDVNYQLLDNAQADTPVQQWLMANCWKYGFILRYPADKVPLTGIIYEPWHYRYVGEENAKAIYDSGLCLEEWLAQN